MKDLAALLGRMVDAGVIVGYALFGAMAQIRYTEPVATVDFDGTPIRVVTADYLAVIALSVGRAKDYARILALLEADATTVDTISLLASRFALDDRWASFRKRFLDE